MRSLLIGLQVRVTRERATPTPNHTARPKHQRVPLAASGHQPAFESVPGSTPVNSTNHQELVT